MWLERVRRYILPGEIEQNPGFREEIERLSHIGLWVVGCAEIVVTIFMILSQMLVQPDNRVFYIRVSMCIAMITLGCFTLAAAQIKLLYRSARLIGCVSALLAAAVLIWTILLTSRFDRAASQLIPGQITLIMLVVVAAIPVRPTDILLCGFGMESVYVGLALFGQAIEKSGVGVHPLYVLYIFMLSCLAAALVAMIYNQRRSAYEWHVSTLEAAENLRLAESRNLLSQNAASVGRLAAALSHELNSPIGALVSGVDTLLLLASRQATSDESQQQRLVILQSELRKSIKASTDRLREIVARMQRFTNLDKAEVQEANINDILSDVAMLLESNYKHKAAVDLQFSEVPKLVCRPQQLSAVFSNLLGNAIEATDGDGRITVMTQKKESDLEVLICDNGKGLSKEELASIFDPGFKVVKGRVSTGNWNMFSSRQIVQEHGGDISISSQAGGGTCVRVAFPADDGAMTLT